MQILFALLFFLIFLRYDLWGPSVNMSSRMQSSGLPNVIQVLLLLFFFFFKI